MDIFEKKKHTLKGLNLKGAMIIFIALTLSVVVTLLNINAEGTLEFDLNKITQKAFWIRQSLNIASFFIAMTLYTIFKIDSRKSELINSGYEELKKTVDYTVLESKVNEYNQTIKDKKKDLLNARYLISKSKKNVKNNESYYKKLNLEKHVIYDTVLKKMILSTSLIVLGMFSLPSITNFSLNNLLGLLTLYLQVAFGIFSGTSLAEELITASKEETDYKKDVIKMLLNK